MKRSWAVAAIMMTGAWFGAAHAQGASCAEEDLKCRIAALEARLAALESKPAPAAAPQSASKAAPEIYAVRKTCKVNCAEEAAAECRKRGFAGGAVRNLDRPKGGQTVLTLIACKT